MRAVFLTDGPVLEMGMGYNSSLFLHWACFTTKRPLVSYETNPEYFRFAKDYRRDFHEVFCIDNWERADIERPWDVALVDLEPAWKRKDIVRKLANFVKYLVVHDTEGRSNRIFGFREIFPLFEWQYNYDYSMPKTSVLSNLVDLTNFDDGWPK